MRKILIIGASRGIGSETLKAARARGFAVRALARAAPASAGADPAGADPALEWRAGDALEPADVSAAVAGVEAVIVTLGIPMNRAMFFGPVRLFSEAARVIIAAMRQQGVRRLVCVTGFGAGESRANIGWLQGLGFRLVFGRAYDDKDLQEELIRGSGLDWVIARPGVLTNGPASGRYQVLLERERWRNGLISRADVADFLVRAVETDAYLGQAPVLVR